MTPDSGAGGIEVLVEGGDWGFGPADAAGLAREAAEAALAAADARGGLAILLADDARLADLNAAFRSKTGPTNVLSFPGSQLAPGDAAGPVLGDIVLARETIEREASLEGKPIDDHLLHLVIHGFLHLFGYDHENEADAATMENLESRALAVLGVKDPYAE